MEPARKRQRSESSGAGFSMEEVLELGVPLHAFARLAEKKKMCGKRRMRAIKTIGHRRLHRAIETQYGNVVRAVTVAGADGAEATVCMACPFALLSHLCEANPQIGDVLANALATRVGRACLYIDDVKPGNIKRPDLARTYTAVYWAVMDLPDWMLHRIESIGWLPVLYVLLKDLQDAKITPSALMNMVVKHFWSSMGHNLETIGMRIHTSSGMAHIRIRLQCFLSDEKAIKEVFCVKGASGSKPCCSCFNVVGRISPHDVRAGLVHFSDYDLSQCVPLTAETFATAARRVQEMAAAGNSIKEVEQALGLSYEPGGMAFDREGLSIARLPETVYWDWQHSLVASGGVAQYQLNQFVRKLTASGISCADLDAFAKTIRWPRNSTKLPGNFFQKRVVHKPGKHLRAFANETLSAIDVLHFFSLLVLRPMGWKPDHVLSLELLLKIVSYIQHSANDRTILPLLEEALAQHHVTYLALYGDCVKPKNHYMRHVPQCIRRHGKTLSCFSSERRHKNSKRKAAFCYKNVCKSMLAYDILDLKRRATVGHEHCLEATILQEPATSCEKAEEWFSHMLPVVSVKASSGISTASGSYWQKDVLLWKEGASVHVGTAEHFLHIVAPPPGLPEPFFVTLQKHELVSPGCFRMGVRRRSMLPVSLILRAVPYRWADGVMHVLMSPSDNVR